MNRRTAATRSHLQWDRQLFVLGLGLAFAPAVAQAESRPTPPNYTIAFIGDQGLGSGAEAAIELINTEGASLVLHQGDFDYIDRPDLWDALLQDNLDPSIRFLAVAGNHDTAEFYGAGGYQEVLEGFAGGLIWQGELGVEYSLEHAGIHLVFTSPGLFGLSSESQASYVESEFANSDAIWRISAWHLLQHEMQSGTKGDESGWPIYETSRRMGAITATAHEHAYSRTSLLSNMEGLVVASTGSPLALAEDDPLTTTIDEGRSFAFVSGLAGQSIRSQSNSGPQFASIYTSTQGAKNGVMFGVFNYQGDPRRARFYFKNVDGEIVDDVVVVSPVGDDPPPPCGGQTCACANGIDDDGDGLIGYPADPGCAHLQDDSERDDDLVCDDGLDNDGDGATDYPADTDCQSPADNSEEAQTSEVLVAESFADDAGSFGYRDDTFRNTSNPSKASGDRVSSGHLDSGALRVHLGSKSTNMSGGWAASFDVPDSALEVEVRFAYRLVVDGSYESNEHGEALASLDGELLGVPPNEYLHRYVGDGNSPSADMDSGWREVSFTFDLEPGAHELIVGGFNNKTTATAEVTDIYLDNVEIVASLSVCTDDIDEDGFACSVDCDDTDPGIFPGALDACDNVDNDCDGSSDEDFVSTPTNCGVGACADTGAMSCIAGAVVDTCSPGVAAPDDATCDAIDDDCNGTSDEDYVAQASSCGVGVCISSGLLECAGGSTIDSCVPLTAPSTVDVVCDGLDEDCDGIDDDDFPGASCETGLPGVCAPGTSMCTGANEVCEPDVAAAPDDATCDGLDDDCDGATDEDFVAGACETGELGVCAVGVSSCSGGAFACTAEDVASAELCVDGLDNDCDGTSDCSDDDCQADPACADTSILELDFDADSAGFAYDDDMFFGTSEPSYSTGDWAATAGSDGSGVLRVEMGGVNGADIVGMSAGWERTFTLSSASRVTLTLRADLQQSQQYERDERSWLVVGVDDTLHTLAELVGDGGGGPAITTGWQSYDVDLGTFGPGSHTLRLGGYNSKKTTSDEVTVVLIDDVALDAAAGTLQLVAEASFDSDVSDFVFMAGAFRGTSASTYELGQWRASDGVDGTGALAVELGGITGDDIADMSAGWQLAIDTAAAGELRLSFDYKFTQGGGYESSEYGEMLVAIDGALVGTAGADRVCVLSGDGDSGPAIGHDWVNVQLSLGSLAAGSHVITLGGYNNMKTYANEWTEILLDNVRVDVEVTAP